MLCYGNQNIMWSGITINNMNMYMYIYIQIEKHQLQAA